MKFTSKQKGIPHPLLRAEHLDVNEIERKLKLCQRFVVGDEAIKRVETTKRFKNYSPSFELWEGNLLRRMTCILSRNLECILFGL